MKFMLLLTALVILVLAYVKSQAVPHICSVQGYFPAKEGEPCFDNAHNETDRCDYFACVNYPSYNLWLKYPYICPAPPENVFLEGKCGPPPNALP